MAAGDEDLYEVCTNYFTVETKFLKKTCIG